MASNASNGSAKNLPDKTSGASTLHDSPVKPKASSAAPHPPHSSESSSARTKVRARDWKEPVTRNDQQIAHDAEWSTGTYAEA